MPTWPIARSATCSCRPRSCPTARPFSARRRPRPARRATPWMFHLWRRRWRGRRGRLVRDRPAQFIGRGRTAANPATRRRRCTGRGRSADTEGSVLDPIVAIRRPLRLSPDESAVPIIVPAWRRRAQASLALLGKYRDRRLRRARLRDGLVHDQEVLRHLNATEADAQVYGRLAGSVIYAQTPPARRAQRSSPATSSASRACGAFGISGDLPIVLRAHRRRAKPSTWSSRALQAHAYWRSKGLAADLVILNEDFSGYRPVLQDQIMGLIHGGPEAQSSTRPGGVFVRRGRGAFRGGPGAVPDRRPRRPHRQPMDPGRAGREPRDRASACRRAFTPIATAERRRAADALAATRDASSTTAWAASRRTGASTSSPSSPVRPRRRPGSNVIASPHIGTVVSESGGAYTWVENAHEFRLTTWHNDPVSDSSGEAFYIRDEETGGFWSPTPLPAPGGPAMCAGTASATACSSIRSRHLLGTVDLRGHGRAGEVRRS